MQPFFVAVSVTVFSCVFARDQHIAVTGQVFCPSDPEAAVGIKVRLTEEDFGPDDHIAEGVTDADGVFSLDGSESEVTNIDTRIKFYHKCDHFQLCHRKWEFKVPDRYINSNETMDMGKLNLEMRLKDEETDCF